MLFLRSSKGYGVLTNIEIDDLLLKEAMETLGLKTERATVEAALRLVVSEEQREKAILNMKGLGWDGDLDAMRKGHGT